jgi:hypothetical protein
MSPDSLTTKVLVIACRLVLANTEHVRGRSETERVYMWWDNIVVPLFKKFDLVPEEWFLKNSLPDECYNKKLM